MKYFINILKKLLLLFYLIGGLSFPSLAQNNVIDSLENLLKTSLHDTLKIKVLNDLSWELNNVGNYASAMQRAYQALRIGEEINYKQGISHSYNIIGATHSNQGNNNKGLDNYLKSMTIDEELGDKASIARSSNNIGTIYDKLGNYNKALEYYLKSLSNFKELNNKEGVATNYTNIGSIYLSMADSALIEKDKLLLKALDYQFNAIKIFSEINDNLGKSVCYINIGEIYFMQNQIDKAKFNIEIALQLFKEMGYREGIQESYLLLSNLFKSTKDFKQAFQFHKLYSETKDSLFNEASSKQIAEVQVKYDSEKKENDLIKKDAEIVIQRAEAEKNQSQRNGFIIGFLIVLILAFFAFRGYRQKRAANVLLEEKNLTITHQRKEIEKKNFQIISSIQYAKGIQDAILPIKTDLQRLFPNHFILNKPKDIVGGDFYWMHENNEKLFFAVADCTGHGVPGAFVTFMGHNILENFIDSKENLCPSDILEKLNNNILKILKQENSNTTAKHGMEIGLFSIDKKNRMMEYAGARHSIFIFRENDFFELRGDRRSIGSIKINNQTDFNNQSFQLIKNDMLYLFSDGFRDQKGGPENKKMFFESFKDLLQTISHQELDEQYRFLEETLQDWKGNNKQTDDVLVVGIRV